MMRDERIQEQRQKGLQESLRELEDLMAECVFSFALLHLLKPAYSEVKLDQRVQPDQQ